jgi:hypothetical protein
MRRCGLSFRICGIYVWVEALRAFGAWNRSTEPEVGLPKPDVESGDIDDAGADGKPHVNAD